MPITERIRDQFGAWWDVADARGVGRFDVTHEDYDGAPDAHDHRREFDVPRSRLVDTIEEAAADTWSPDKTATPKGFCACEGCASCAENETPDGGTAFPKPLPEGARCAAADDGYDGLCEHCWDRARDLAEIGGPCGGDRRFVITVGAGSVRRLEIIDGTTDGTAPEDSPDRFAVYLSARFAPTTPDDAVETDFGETFETLPEAAAVYETLRRLLINGTIV